VKPADLKVLLEEAYVEKRALRSRHEAVARRVQEYDLNNTYQYVIAREDLHLQWLRDAVLSAGGAPQAVEAPASSDPIDPDAASSTLILDDAQAARAFVDRWRDRVAAVSDARERLMLNVVLGETLEHQRFFELAAAGQTDLLGRRTGGAPVGGGVLATRWVE
jgi:hypothetical protein